MKAVKKVMEMLSSFLNMQDFVRAAYMFGSVAEGRQGPMSDIDVAVFMDKKLGKKERSKKKIFLINKICSILKTDNVDLVVMNDASLLLNYNIIKQGKVLKTGKERVFLETRLMCDYLDRKFYDDMYARASLDRVAREGIA
jgi:predicted nucleotidyltransferase